MKVVTICNLKKKTIKILHIDDERDFLEISKMFLSKISTHNIHIESTSDPINSLQLLKQNHYDLIISDYQMPNLNGLDLLKIIRSHNNSIPFIIFTGRGREEIAIEALNNGANYYIKKGGDIEAQFTQLLYCILNLVQFEDTKKALKNSELKFRSLFEETPIAQAERDYSEVKKYLDNLKQQGITDFDLYFTIHPENVLKCSELIKLGDVNQAALDLFNIKHKEDFSRIPSRFMNQKQAYDGFKKQLVLFANGITRHETQAKMMINGHEHLIIIVLHIPKSHVNSFSRVWAKYIDVTHYLSNELLNIQV